MSAKRLGMGLALVLLCAVGVYKARQLKESSRDPGGEDLYQWLEVNESSQTKSWVTKKNEDSAQFLKADPRFNQIAAHTRKILTAQDRIAYPSVNGDLVRNFWTDQDHQRGLWRQTSLENYLEEEPEWETILDVDALNQKEGKSWVFKGARCLPPENDRCLVELSDGGGDTAVIREFQISTKSFVKDGFQVPPAKSEVSWIDKDTVLAQTDFGPGSLTTSGYPRIAKIWKRGTELKDAQTVFKGEKDDVSAGGYVIHRSEGPYVFFHRSLSFYESETFWFKDGQAIKVPKPDTARVVTVFDGQMILSVKEDWTLSDRTIKRGSALSFPMGSLQEKNVADKIQVLFEPTDEQAYQGVSVSKNFLLLHILNNVNGEIHKAFRKDGTWSFEEVGLPKNGDVAVASARFDSDKVFFRYENFTVPSTLYYMDESGSMKVAKQLPPKFDASNLEVSQNFAVSRDGTRVPYFIIHKKSMKLDGSNPTLMYGYGGFRVSMTPFYSAVSGKVWLEKGGVYVLTNIRGGAEYGPSWHAAALKKNRHKAFEDFEAIAKDLIERGITSPRKLGIMGGSNGGLLVGAAATRAPELYNAVVCNVPLLDMIRYTQLPPGASWIGEYGDPKDQEMAEYIRTYSPYQNVKENETYPEIFFYTSSKDDRVHPGHARKMAAKMEGFGHRVWYYENIEGGHGGAADIEQRVEMISLQYTYLFKKLFDSKMRR